MNQDAMWPGQIRRDGHGNLWICTDSNKDFNRWTRVTGWARDYRATFRLSEDDDNVIFWDVVDEPIRPPLPRGQVRISTEGTAWQKLGDGTWGNSLTPARLNDDDVRDLQIIWTPEDQ